MIWLRLSRHMRMGRPRGSVISDQKAWKTGQATSGSLAPSSQRRARVVFDWTGMGRLYSLLIGIFCKTALFALPICPSQFAVYVFCVHTVGLVPFIGA